MSKSIAVVFLLGLAAAAPSQAQLPPAPDTPFGVGFTPRNFPGTTIADIQPAMIAGLQVGSHMSFVWSWDRPASKTHVQNQESLAKDFGMMTLVQMAPTQMGAPRPPEGFAATFADPDTRTRYLEDVEFIAAMQPQYINLCAEVNIMYHFNNDEFLSYISLYQEAFDLVRQISPDSKVGFSLLHSMWIGFQQYSLPYDLGGDDYLDFIAFTTYPGARFYNGDFGDITIDEFPANWYSPIRDAYPDWPVLFTEVGWASTVAGSEVDQALFLANLPRLFGDVQPELVTWTLLSDTDFFQTDALTPEQLEFLESVGVNPDDLFGRFNGMGLLYRGGEPKDAFVTATQLDFGYGAPVNSTR